MGVLKPELIMKSVVPVVMAGILGIYGMIVAVIIVQRSNNSSIQSLILTLINQHTPIWLQAFAAASVLLYNCSNSGGWTGNWYRGRRRSACERSAGQDFCGYDSDFDFRISLGLVWADRLADSYLAMIRFDDRIANQLFIYRQLPEASTSIYSYQPKSQIHCNIFLG